MYVVNLIAVADGAGNPISSANSNNVAIVGQAMSLQALTCGGTFSNYQWTVPSTAFSAFNANNQTGGVVWAFALTNSGVVGFSWIDAGAKQVSVSAVCAGIQLLTNAAITVVRPTACIKTFTGTVAVDNNYAGNGTYWLHFGEASTNPGVAGIFFSNTVVLPSGYYNGGNTNCGTEWVQLVNSFDREFQTNNAAGTWYRRGPPLTNSVLDTVYPYIPIAPRLTEDSPAEPLLVNATNAPYKTVTAADSFTMWLMFQPTNGQWVPLRTVSWSGTEQRSSRTPRAQTVVTGC